MNKFTFLSLGFGVFRNGGEGIYGKMDFIWAFCVFENQMGMLLILWAMTKGMSQLIISLPTPHLTMFSYLF